MSAIPVYDMRSSRMEANRPIPPALPLTYRYLGCHPEGGGALKLIVIDRIRKDRRHNGIRGDMEQRAQKQNRFIVCYRSVCAVWPDQKTVISSCVHLVHVIFVLLSTIQTNIS